MLYNILMIETTSQCNAKCSYCPRSVLGKRFKEPPRVLSQEVLKKALLLAQCGTNKGIWLHHSGEPFLHPELPSIIRTVRLAGFYAYLSTNLLHFNLQVLEDVFRSGLNDLRVHLSAALTTLDPDEALFRIHLLRKLNWTVRDNACRIEVTYGLTRESPDDVRKNLSKHPYYDESMHIDFYQPHDWPGLYSGNDHQVDYRNCKWYSTNSCAVLANGDLVICCLDQLGASRVANVMDISSIEWEHLRDRGLCVSCIQYHEMDDWIVNEGLRIPDWLSRRLEFDPWM